MSTKKSHSWLLGLLVAAVCACGDGTPDSGPIDSGVLTDAGNMPDQDQDEWADSEDNCPGTANPEQRDRDRDGIGDACDSCPATPNNGQNGLPGQDSCDVVAETEPNDAQGNGMPIVLSTEGRILEVRGSIEAPAAGEQSFDRFSVMVPARTMLHVRAARTSGDSLLEPAILVTGGSFTVARIVDAPFVAERDIYVTTSGTYEIAIGDRRGLLFGEPQGDAAFGYALAIETVAYDVERLTPPIDAQVFTMSPVGKVWVLDADVAMADRTRFETSTELGSERSTAGIDTILIVEQEDGTLIEENDDVADGYLDSRILAAFDRAQRVRIILDHHRVIGGADADLEVRFTLDIPPREVELEPNDNSELAGALIYPGETQGRVADPTPTRPDVDWFTIDATGGQVATFFGLIAPNGLIDPFIAVGQVAGGQFEPMYFNLDSSGTSARVDVIFPETGRYYLAIGDQRNGEPPFRGGALYEYRIFAEIAGIQPASVLTSTGTLSSAIDPGGRVIRHLVTTNGPTLLTLDTTSMSPDGLTPHLRVYGQAAVKLLGDGIEHALAYLPQAGTFVVGVHNDEDGAGDPLFTYDVLATQIPLLAGMESEPNDAIGAEDRVPLPGVIEAGLAAADDVDRYVVRFDAGSTIDAVLTIGGRDRTIELYEPGNTTPIAMATGALWAVPIITSGDHVVVIGSMTSPGPYTLAVRAR